MSDLPSFALVGDDALAPGAPGLAPTWSSSDKDFVTTSLGQARVWVTLGHGVLNEVYWPSTGEPQLRDLTFYLVGEGGWVDLKRTAHYTLSVPAPFLPLPTVVHTGADYQLTLEVVPDPLRDVLLVRYELQGPYTLAVVAAPHLNGDGHDNVAWVDGACFAHCHRRVLCLTADSPLRQASAGIVGVSDGWQDLQAHGRLTWAYTKAGPGNVALSLALARPQGVLALGFSNTARGAYTLARASLAEGADAARGAFLHGWSQWARHLPFPAPDPELGALAQFSAAVLKMHEDTTYPGAVVASLSTPWGEATDTLGGYHLVWPRDATLAAFALLAAGQLDDARRILARFVATQEEDGHWAQNSYPSGDPFWTGLQLDETAFPVLLAAKLRELGDPEPAGVPEMVRRALGFVARTGPTSDQDRWEENPGVNPFTVAVAIAALVAGAPWLAPDQQDEALRLADEWNERLEGWCYVEDTPLAREHGVRGYYVRLAPPQKDGGLGGEVLLRNRLGETLLASALVSLDFSYLTRLGLRHVTDPRVQDTLRVVDRVLRVSTPSGDLYRRYNHDGYGEHDDGRPFDGNGTGRLWPLLAGERGHLALQAGEDALPYLRAMAHCASDGGLLPEQVWDGPALPERGLFPGRPSGSAMPLVWSHAEFLKLLLARESGRPFELLRAVEDRYAHARPAPEWRWRNETPVAALPPGRDLRLESPVPFTLHYGWDGWQDVQEAAAQPGPFGLWQVCLGAEALAAHDTLHFTRRFETGWEGQDHRVALQHAPAQALTPT
ncbi:glycoside hydrolase family 15 protein [Deinococcus multiflagellatus]|uniref:Glycoside hydrolase family 15 protein n=1 Tax=Deinococcus multiflagellatus TaxID=1656887 RepID=A0ABW1ZFW5_9DEIO|nr:glycoside hydrolase family 15 protein [Deinococcus multiflagellatus]MBZ9711815.1 glycoside hydrolase family 15 protein [Deinococcus multiflagellatus]